MTTTLEAKPTTIPTLPALRSLGSLADVRPVVVIDTREQTPLPIARLAIVRAGLDTGDYSYIGGETTFSVERKTVQDLAGCCTGDNRERFERELARLRGYRFKRLLVIGNHAEVTEHRYRGKVIPKAVLASLNAWEIRFDVPVVWSASPETAAAQVESWIYWHARETVKDANALLAAAKQ